MPGETYERVRAMLAALRRRYGSFPVRQTTVPVPTDTYDQLLALADRSVVDAGVRVRNEHDDVLAVRNGDGWSEPYRHVDDAEPIEAAACQALREATDVRCEIDGLLGVTIVHLTDGDDGTRDPIYRLIALFDGGVADDCADCRWRSTAAGPFAAAY